MICHGSQPISLGRLEHFCEMIHLRSLDQKSIYWHFSDPSSASETWLVLVTKAFFWNAAGGTRINGDGTMASAGRRAARNKNSHARAAKPHATRTQNQNDVYCVRSSFAFEFFWSWFMSCLVSLLHLLNIQRARVISETTRPCTACDSMTNGHQTIDIYIYIYVCIYFIKSLLILPDQQWFHQSIFISPHYFRHKALFTTWFTSTTVVLLNRASCCFFVANNSSTQSAQSAKTYVAGEPSYTSQLNLRFPQILTWPKTI